MKFVESKAKQNTFFSFTLVNKSRLIYSDFSQKNDDGENLV